MLIDSVGASCSHKAVNSRSSECDLTSDIGFVAIFKHMQRLQYTVHMLRTIRRRLSAAVQLSTCCNIASLLYITTAVLYCQRGCQCYAANLPSKEEARAWQQYIPVSMQWRIYGVGRPLCLPAFGMNKIVMCFITHKWKTCAFTCQICGYFS